MKRLLFLLLLLPTFAIADDDVLLSCQIDGSSKTLTILETDTDLVYKFGPREKSELSLTDLKSTLSYTPWDGMGSVVSESVIFQNNEFSYEVWKSFDRNNIFKDPKNVRTAGVKIFKDGQSFADLLCDKNDIQFTAFAFEDALKTEELLFNCQIEDSEKQLSLVATKTNFTYSFGSEDKPELTLTETKEDATFIPWDGVGRIIYEALLFKNNGFEYEVWMAFDNFFNEEDPAKARFAGVKVFNDGEETATFFCNSNNLDFDAFALSDALKWN